MDFSTSFLGAEKWWWEEVVEGLAAQSRCNLATDGTTSVPRHTAHGTTQPFTKTPLDGPGAPPFAHSIEIETFGHCRPTEIDSNGEKGSFEVWRKWVCDPWSPWGARIARWRGPGSEAGPVRLMPRSPRRGCGPARTLLTRMRRILGMAEILCPIPGIPRPRYTNSRSFSQFWPLSGCRPGRGLVGE